MPWVVAVESFCKAAGRRVWGNWAKPDGSCEEKRGALTESKCDRVLCMTTFR